jgi:hypothetical protein
MILVLGTTIKCPHFFFYFIFIMANPAYDQALTTGQVVIRKWWVNTNSTKNQMSVQFQQAVERPQTESSANSLMISLEQGTDNLSNFTNVTAIRSLNADKAAAFLGSKEGDATMGSPVYTASQLYRALGLDEDIAFAIQVTENFEPNQYSKSHDPKINPATGEVVVATNPATGTQMPVYRHTALQVASNCKHTFIVGESPRVGETVKPGTGFTTEIAS